MHFKTLYKVIILLSFVIFATCIAFLVYILGEKAYIDWLKADTNKAWGWGFIVGLILFYALPLCLLISSFLFLKKTILFWIPYIILLIYAIDESFIGSCPPFTWNFIIIIHECWVFIFIRLSLSLSEEK